MIGLRWLLLQCTLRTQMYMYDLEYVTEFVYVNGHHGSLNFENKVVFGTVLFIFDAFFMPEFKCK